MSVTQAKTVSAKATAAKAETIDGGICIYGERLMLRQLSRDDVSEDYVAWLNDPLVNRYLESRFQHFTLEAVRAFVIAISGRSNEFLFGMFSTDSREHIGNIKLGPVNTIHRRAEVGLLIGAKHCWGKGYGTEAIRLLTDYAFTVLKLNKLEAGCYESNHGSRHAFLKAGYRVEGYSHCQFMCDDRLEAGFRLGCINPDLLVT